MWGIGRVGPANTSRVHRLERRRHLHPPFAVVEPRRRHPHRRARFGVASLGVFVALLCAIFAFRLAVSHAWRPPLLMKANGSSIRHILRGRHSLRPRSSNLGGMGFGVIAATVVTLYFAHLNTGKAQPSRLPSTARARIKRRHLLDRRAVHRTGKSWIPSHSHQIHKIIRRAIVVRSNRERPSTHPSSRIPTPRVVRQHTRCCRLQQRLVRRPISRRARRKKVHRRPNDRRLPPMNIPTDTGPCRRAGDRLDMERSGATRQHCGN